jgi:hypothetical protein
MVPVHLKCILTLCGNVLIEIETNSNRNVLSQKRMLRNGINRTEVKCIRIVVEVQ